MTTKTRKCLTKINDGLYAWRNLELSRTGRFRKVWLNEHWNLAWTGLKEKEKPLPCGKLSKRFHCLNEAGGYLIEHGFYLP